MGAAGAFYGEALGWTVTGRFAVVADPRGGCLRHAATGADAGQEGAGGAFNQRKAGHDNCNELVLSNPVAGIRF